MSTCITFRPCNVGQPGPPGTQGIPGPIGPKGEIGDIGAKGNLYTLCFKFDYSKKTTRTQSATINKINRHRFISHSV
jgi:hypothetical protein